MNQCQTDKQTTMDPRSSDALVTICYNRQADKPPDFDRKQFVRWNGETMKREIEVYGASRHARRDTSLAYEVWREEEKCDRMIRKWWETWWKNVKKIQRKTLLFTVPLGIFLDQPTTVWESACAHGKLGLAMQRTVSSRSKFSGYLSSAETMAGEHWLTMAYYGYGLKEGEP